MPAGRHVDVVVAGLGAMGSATLYQLAKAGRRVVGIDRFSPPHDHGSSHGETRITRMAVGEGLDYVPLAMRSHEIWDELARASGRTLIERCGLLLMGLSDLDRPDATAMHHGKSRFLARTVEAARLFGIPHHLYDAAAIRERFPQFAVPDGTEGYFEPGAGFLYPEACISAQLSLAERHGGRIVTGTEVLSVAQHGDAVEVETTDGPYRAGHVVLACGAWLPAFLDDDARTRLTVTRQVLHWFEVEDEPAFSPARCPVYIWLWGPRGDDLFYGFPSLPGSGRIKVATETADPVADPSLVDRVVGDDQRSAFFARHLDGHLEGVRPAGGTSRTCLYTDADDHGFFIDTLPGQDRIIAVSACSGHGFKHSAAIGEAVAGTIVTGRIGDALKPFRTARPRPAAG